MPTIAELKEAHAKRIRYCRSCQAKIVWFKTKKNDRWMPIDAGTVKASDTKINLAYHTSHFATCPNANRHRKPRGETSRARR